MTTDPAPSLLSLVDPGAAAEQLLAPHSPEALFISALVDSGVYRPRAYGVPDHAIRGHRAVHEWCLRYQEHAGSAPPVHLLLRDFPSFDFTPGVSPGWAAHEVIEQETNRVLRKGISQALHALGDEANGEAVTILRSTVDSVSTANRPGTLVTDFRALRDTQDQACCPIPPGLLSGLTGGIPAGQLWLIAALWGVGKSWELLLYAIAAAESGWRVVIFSLEMSIAEILNRLHVLALREWGNPSHSMTLDEREAAIHEWAESAAEIEIRGPMDGRVDAGTIAGAADKGSKTLILVDYVGKMYSLAGEYAGTDHVIQKQVSNELKGVAASHGIPIVAAAQLNRLGQLGGSIALEQDADLILEKSLVGASGAEIQCIRKNRLVKTRHTAAMTHWYSRFDAVHGRFDDITHEEAMRLRSIEEAATYN